MSEPTTLPPPLSPGRPTPTTPAQQLTPPAVPTDPPRPSAPPSAGPPRRGALRLAVGALAAGVALEVGVRGGLANLVVSVGVVLVVAVLLAEGRITRPAGRWAAAAAILPAAGLAVRVSPWLVTANAAAVAVLVAAAVAFGQSGSLFHTSPSRLLGRAMLTLEGILAGTALLRPLLPRATAAGRRRMARIGGAVLVTLPLLGTMVLLLASADAVFAELLLPDVQLGPAAGHVTLACLFAALVVGLVAAAREDTDELRLTGTFGVAEIATVLSMALAVLGLFVVAQLVALTDAGDRLVASSGLTPAEYARSGFFQLCWATAVLMGFLALVRAMATPEALAHGVVRVLAGAVPALAVGLVMVSLRRMALYDQAFGLTMLRLWVVGAAVWMGATLVMVALRNLGAGGGRDWVVGGAGTAALALVLVANLANPEGFVVRHNVARARNGADLDATYLAGLSADAVPALADATDALPPGAERRQLVAALACRDDDRTGVATLNLALPRAADARTDVVAPGSC